MKNLIPKSEVENLWGKLELSKIVFDSIKF